MRENILSLEEVSDAVAGSAGTGLTWLERLLVTGILDEERLCKWVSETSLVPRCDLDRLARAAPSVIAQLPAEVALEHRIVPLSLDGRYLNVAMVDPTDSLAVQEAEFFTGRQLMREVAQATAIAWALYHHYGARSLLWPPSPAPGAPSWSAG